MEKDAPLDNRKKLTALGIWMVAIGVWLIVLVSARRLGWF